MGTLPFSPSALPWWGWMLCAAGCAAVALMSNSSHNKYGGSISGALTAAGGIAAFILGFIGIYRYMNWI